MDPGRGKVEGSWKILRHLQLYDFAAFTGKALGQSGIRPNTELPAEAAQWVQGSRDCCERGTPCAGTR